MTDKNKDKKNIGQQKLCITANHIGYPLPIETALAMSATTVCIPIAPRTLGISKIQDCKSFA
jgi:hypothetical protein